MKLMFAEHLISYNYQFTRLSSDPDAKYDPVVFPSQNEDIAENILYFLLMCEV